MRSIFSGMITGMALAASFTVPAAAQESIPLTFVTGYPAGFSFTKAFVDHFGPRVNERLAADGKYQVNWNYAVGGTLAKPGGELEMISTGLADIGLIPTPAHVDKLPLYNLSYMTPFTTGDMNVIQSAQSQLYERFKDEFDADWDRQNQVFLTSLSPLPTYWIVSREAINSIDDLNGMKIAGVGPNLRWVAGVGGTGVNAPGSEWYQQLNNGVVDGVMAWADAAGSMKLCEPAKFAYDAGIGTVTAVAVSFNKQSWERLPEDVRTAIDETVEEFVAYHTENLIASSIKQAEFCETEQKMQIITASDEERKRWAMSLPPMALDWAKELDDKGRPGTEMLQTYMTLLREAGQPIARNWDTE